MLAVFAKFERGILRERAKAVENACESGPYIFSPDLSWAAR
jgi:hypothetical protein